MDISMNPLFQWPSIHRLREAIHLSIPVRPPKPSSLGPPMAPMAPAFRRSAFFRVHEKKGGISRGKGGKNLMISPVDIGKISWFHQKKLVIFCNEGDNFWDCSWKIDYRNCSPKYMLEEWEWEWQLIALKFVKSEHDQHVSTLGKWFEMFEVLEPNLRLFPTWMAMHVGDKQIGDRVTDDLVVKMEKQQKMLRSPGLLQMPVFCTLGGLNIFRIVAQRAAGSLLCCMLAAGQSWAGFFGCPLAFIHGHGSWTPSYTR